MASRSTSKKVIAGSIIVTAVIALIIRAYRTSEPKG